MGGGGGVCLGGGEGGGRGDELGPLTDQWIPPSDINYIPYISGTLGDRGVPRHKTEPR